MAKSYLTLEERERAARNIFNNKQDNALRVELIKAKKLQRLTYKELADKASVGVSTVRKILDVSLDLGTIELDKLRSVCGALGIQLRLCAE